MWGDQHKTKINSGGRQEEARAAGQTSAFVGRLPYGCLDRQGRGVTPRNERNFWIRAFQFFNLVKHGNFAGDPGLDDLSPSSVQPCIAHLLTQVSLESVTPHALQDS